MTFYVNKILVVFDLYT